MTRAQNRGAQVRRELVPARPGLEVWAWPLRVLQEMQAGDLIGGAQRLGLPWRWWMMAQAIGHKPLHLGNHLWMREHTLLGAPVGREAYEFAYRPLVDGQMDHLDCGFVACPRSANLQRNQDPERQPQFSGLPMPVHADTGSLLRPSSVLKRPAANAGTAW